MNALSRVATEDHDICIESRSYSAPAFRLAESICRTRRQRFENLSPVQSRGCHEFVFAQRIVVTQKPNVGSKDDFTPEPRKIANLISYGLTIISVTQEFQRRNQRHVPAFHFLEMTVS